MRWWLCIAVVLHARAADADILDVVRGATQQWAPTQEAKISRQLQKLQELNQQIDDAILLATMYLESNPVHGAGVDISATAGAGFDIDRGGADASVLASAHVDGEKCALVRADLLVRGRTATSVDDRARGSVDGSGSLCIPDGIDLTAAAEGIPISVFPIRGRAFAALNKTPSLTASRAIIPEPYSELGWGVWMEGMRYLRHRGEYYWAFPGLSIEQRYHWQGFPDGAASRQEIVADAYFFRLGHRRRATALADRAIDIFGFGFHGVQDKAGTAVGEFWPLRVSGLGFGTDRVLADLTVGVSGTGTITSEDTVIDSSEVPDKAIAFVHAALSFGDRRTGFGVTYDRGLETNLLAELVQEDRGSAWTRFQRGPLQVSAAAFAARAIHYPDKVTRGEEQIVGGTLDGSYALGGGVALGMSIEGTHSLRRDAVLDGRVAPDGVRAFATITITHSLVRWVAPPPEPEPEPTMPDPDAPPPRSSDPEGPAGPAEPAEPTAPPPPEPAPPPPA